MNRREIEEIQRIQEDLRRNRHIYDEIRNAKKIHDEFFNSRDNHLRNSLNNLRDYEDTIRHHSLYRNEFFEARNSLQKHLERERNSFGRNAFEEARRISNLSRLETDNFTTFSSIHREVERIKRNFRTNIDEANQIRNNYLNNIPKWEKQLLPSLIFQRDEIDNLLSTQRGLRNQIENFPQYFQEPRFWNEIESIRNTYVGNLAVSLREAVINSENDDEAITKVAALFEEKVSILPQNKLSREFILSLFFAILIAILQVWYSRYLADQSSAELKTYFENNSARIEKIENFLEKNKESISEDNFESNEVFYLVERKVLVKTHPDFKSLTIDYLSEKTKVRSIKMSHKWIYIEYIDYLEVVPRYGWVNKKYLKRLEK